MSVIAFIPARGGSKSIPEKNIKYFCGKPLIYWNLHELQKSEVDEIVVATDSDNIKLVVESFKFSNISFINSKSIYIVSHCTNKAVCFVKVDIYLV